MIEKDPPHRVDGHGGVSRERSRRHAARAAEQPALQSRPARTQRAADVRAAGSAVRASPKSASKIQTLGDGLCRVIARYGFMETPERGRGAARRRREGRAVRTGADRVRRRPRESGVRHRLGHAAVAQAPVRIHGPQQPARRHSLRRAAAIGRWKSAARCGCERRSARSELRRSTRPSLASFCNSNATPIGTSPMRGVQPAPDACASPPRRAQQHGVTAQPAVRGAAAQSECAAPDATACASSQGLVRGCLPRFRPALTSARLRKAAACTI